MIKEVRMYTVICDNCGIDVNKDAEYSCWSERSFAKDCALDANWIEENDKHYCDDCFSVGDDDEIVIHVDRIGLHTSPPPPARIN